MARIICDAQRPRCPIRSVPTRAPMPATSKRDRDARIEELLLAGLDHYFADRLRARDQRLDARAVPRSRPRPRPRLHRARPQRAWPSASAKPKSCCTRGVAAFERGDAGEARAAADAAVEQRRVAGRSARAARPHRAARARRRRAAAVFERGAPPVAARPRTAVAARDGWRARSRCWRPGSPPALAAILPAAVLLGLSATSRCPGAAGRRRPAVRRSSFADARCRVPRRGGSRARAGARAVRRAATCTRRSRALDAVRPPIRCSRRRPAARRHPARAARRRADVAGSPAAEAALASDP